MSLFLALFSSFCIPSSPALTIITLLRSPLVHRRAAPSAARPASPAYANSPPPPLSPTAPDCLAVSRRGGDLVPPLRPLPPPPLRTRLLPQYAGCDRGARFIQGRRPARPTNLWIFSFPTPDEVFQLPTDSVFVLCLCYTPVAVNAGPDPALSGLPTSRPLPVVDEMLSGTETTVCLPSTTDTCSCSFSGYSFSRSKFTLKVVLYSPGFKNNEGAVIVDRDINLVEELITILPSDIGPNRFNKIF